MEEPVGDAREGLRAARAALRSTGHPARRRPRAVAPADHRAGPDGPGEAAVDDAARIAALEAEVARLRHALAEIADHSRHALSD